MGRENTPWTKHPRPQFKRDKFFILNRGWKLNGQDVTLPFPPQSVLSGYEDEISDILIYECIFSVPEDFAQQRIILHFGGVDQMAKIKLNGTFIGEHQGGYISFSFDVTDYIYRDKDNLLQVVAMDELSKDYPYGKQSKNPKGMWYTQVSGIWQNVWLENLPQIYVEKLSITPTPDSVKINISTNMPVENINIKISYKDKVVLQENISSEKNKALNSSDNGLCEFVAGFSIPEPHNWTPDTPNLYDVELVAGEDRVFSYFALRTISITELNGIKRVCLNNKPIFLHGVLDQGYFHDGLFLPRDEEGYDRDILAMKELGFNLLRKHIKIEPEYFYYACDKLGMLVMQDMVNNGSYSFVRDTALPTIGFKKRNDTKLNKSEKTRNIFKEHTNQTIKQLYNHPCIIAYTIFNEGWGQFCSDDMYDYVKSLDGTRLIDSTSGWFAGEKNDFDSEHIYFRLKKLKVKERPMFITECGGYKYMDSEHFFGKKEYGYGTCKSSDELTCRIENMYQRMIIPYVKDGVCGCIYTQLSDVEGEINGLYTYDRKVCKVHKKRIQKISEDIKKCL